MNDRFKFRVWNKEQNRFHHSFCCDITASGTLVISQGIEGKKYIVDDDNYVVQQCTGLKDKNGKLIYEGDIIEFTDNVNINGSKTHIAKVEHREEFNAYMYHAECMGWYTINPSQNKLFKVKVIGNIYENKELLNEI